MQNTDNSTKSDKKSSAVYSLITIGILLAIFIDVLLFFVSGHAALLVVGIILAITLIAIAPIRKRGQVNLRRWGESDRYSFVIILILAVIAVDLLLFIGPGGGHLIVFLELIGGPIVLIFLGPTVSDSFISSLIAIVHFVGVIAYSIRPRLWTKIITIVSVTLWWIFGMAVAFIGV